MAKKLRVFDFDDTLAKTRSFVYVTHGDGSESELTPAEFALYQKKEGDEFDFRDFADIKDPSTIVRIFKMFKRYAGESDSDVYILTARAGNAQPAIKKFLSMADVKIKGIVTLGDSDPMSKASWIKEKMVSGAYNNLLFLDDSKKNIVATAKVLKPYASKVVDKTDVNEAAGDITITTRYFVHDHTYIITAKTPKGKTFKDAISVSETKKENGMKLSELKAIIREVMEEEKEKKYGYTNEWGGKKSKKSLKEWGPEDSGVKDVLAKWDEAVDANNMFALKKIAVAIPSQKSDSAKIMKLIQSNKFDDARKILQTALNDYMGTRSEFADALKAIGIKDTMKQFSKGKKHYD